MPIFDGEDTGTTGELEANTGEETGAGTGEDTGVGEAVEEQGTGTGEQAGEEGTGEEGQDEFEQEIEDLAAYFRSLDQQEQQGQGNQQQVQQPAQGQGQQQDPREVFFEALRNDPFGVINYLVEQGVQQRVAPLVEQANTQSLSANLQAVKADYPQAATTDGQKALFGKVKELAAELGNPALAKNPTKSLLKMAALEAFGEGKGYQAGKNKGREEALQNIKTKKGLATGAAKGQKQTKAPTPEEAIKASILGARRGTGMFG